MERQPFFSVVMPVYNVEKYMDQALESVVGQTFGDFEVILVDDCSPDGSSALCDVWAARDTRVRVQHLAKNGGVSNARNIGRRLACGQYLLFMDSDDYIDADLFAKVYASVQENPAQIVFFGMSEEHFDAAGRHLETVVFQLPQQYFDEQTALRKYMIELEKATLYGYACNKFYQLSYLNQLGLEYQEYALNEDILFNVAYCMDIERMNVLDVPAYHYRKSMDERSRSSQFVKNYFELHENRIRVLLEQYEYWHLCTDDIRADLAAIYTRYIMSALQRNCDARSGMDLGKRKVFVKKLYRQKVFNATIPYGHPESKIVKVLHFCLNKHLTFLCLVLGRLIYIVKNQCPALFNIVQKNR